MKKRLSTKNVMSSYHWSAIPFTVFHSDMSDGIIRIRTSRKERSNMRYIADVIDTKNRGMSKWKSKIMSITLIDRIDKYVNSCQ